jgi:hypothetical protein
MSAPGAPGEIISFYSYKGGTGRTMALANVACLLAEQIGERESVLVVDWDLEAPGLHRFFPPRLAPSLALDLGLDAGPGLIDLFIDIDKAIPPSAAESDEAADAVVDAALSRVDIKGLIADTAVPRVKILRAGRNDDGQYSSRVGRFNWEDLFRRAPTVYQRVAESLAQTHRYVLIDSRTGVTDISGICTSLLPEKLVVVFTPNRQSLTGVRELIEKATAYRKNSDDLRPLVVFPLPSRIEASLEDLRAKWRLGDRDLGIVGYQPMFEDLFKKAYGLTECDLSSYFTDVQIQQTPDYAYGEEIAVRRTSDRFSLGNSYRVFTKRLASSAPPWPVVVTARAISAPPVTAPTPAPVPNAPPVAATPAAPAVLATPRKTPPADRTPAKASAAHATPSSNRPRVFLSYARDDREQAERVSAGLQTSGIEVRLADSAIQPGVDFRSAMAEALDTSNVVVVLWSKTSVRSDWTLAEAEEGLRRGVLIPVLIDEASPPLGFRQLQAVDLRRDPERGIAELVEAIQRTASSAPGQPSSTASAPSPIVVKRRRWLVAAAAMLILGGFAFTLFRTTEVLPPTTMLPGGVATVRVPNFLNFQTGELNKTADSLGVRLILTDEQGKAFESLNGIVTSQQPAPDTYIRTDQPIRLVVAARVVAVPTLAGAKLDDALKALVSAGLALGATETRVVADAPEGSIITQTPSPGTSVPAGSKVNVTVASGRSPSSSVPQAAPPRRPAGRGEGR